MEAAIHGDPEHLVYDHMLCSADSCSCCYELLAVSLDWYSMGIVRMLAKKRSKRLNLPRCWTAWLMTRVMLSIIQLKRWKYNKGVGQWQPGPDGLEMQDRCRTCDVSCGRSSQRQVRLPCRTRILLLTRATRVLSLNLRIKNMFGRNRLRPQD